MKRRNKSSVFEAANLSQNDLINGLVVVPTDSQTTVIFKNWYNLAVHLENWIGS